jgi:hypothetical protein
MLLFKEKHLKRYGYKGRDYTMSTQLENETHFDRDLYQQKLPQHYRNVLSSFQKCTRSFVHFNLLFLTLAVLEVTIFSAFLPVSTGTTYLALALGAFFLTVFSYLVLLFYFQAKKPEQMNLILGQFISSCRSSLGPASAGVIHHLSLAETLLKLSHYLQDYEYKIIRFPNLFLPLTKLISSISGHCYRYDVFQFKQMLLYTAIDEHLEQIRATPTDLEVHTSLASAYVALSKIYKEPKEYSRTSLYIKHRALFDEKFKIAASLAIEEFQILNQYAPNDPWIHEQLASGYRDLNLYKEEIKEVETLLKLRSQDKEILFRLGSLYFQQGLNAKGLEIYEELKKANYKKAEDLISSYGCTSESEHHLSPLLF